MPSRDHRLEHGVHWTLLSGLSASALLLAAGLIAVLVQGGPEKTLHEPLGRLLRDAFHAQGSALTTLGLLVLMTTPILRVIVLLIGWTLKRDWLFAAVALAVLALLIFSLALGAK